MDCPKCRSRSGIEIEMLYEDASGMDWGLVSDCQSKARRFPAANYSCPHCLTEYRWTKYDGLREC